MNDIATRVSDAAAPAAELITLTTETQVAILTDTERFDAFYERVKAEVEGHEPDLSTDKGRKAIASLAYKVVKTKTALDDAGKKLTEDKRKEIAAVDAARKRIRDRLDELRDHVRKPLTDWEAAEEARVARCQAAMVGMKAAAAIRVDDTSDTIAARLGDVEAVSVTADEFGDLFNFATDAKAAAVQNLTAARDRLLQEEADRAELARLRKEAEEREARDAAERAERERQEQEAAAARRAEEEARAKAEADEAARVEAEARAKADAEAQAQRERDAAERAAKEADVRARAEAEAKALAEQEERERQHQAELRAQADARAAAEAEAQRLRDEQQARERAEAETRAAEARRQADIEHRGTIMRAAKEALIEHVEIDEPTAKRIVLAIAANSIPHVSIQF